MFTVHVDAVSVSSSHSDSGHLPEGLSSDRMRFGNRPRLETEQAKPNCVNSERIAWLSGPADQHRDSHFFQIVPSQLDQTKLKGITNKSSSTSSNFKKKQQIF